MIYKNQYNKIPSTVSCKNKLSQQTKDGSAKQARGIVTAALLSFHQIQVSV